MGEGWTGVLSCWPASMWPTSCGWAGAGECALVDEAKALDAEGPPPRGQFGAAGGKVRGHFLLKPSFDYPLDELTGQRTSSKQGTKLSLPSLPLLNPVLRDAQMPLPG